MRNKNRPSLLNTVSFRGQSLEQVIENIRSAERRKFAYSYAPVTGIGHHILNGNLSEYDLRQKFDEDTGDAFTKHKLDVALALLTFGEGLEHQVRPLKPFDLEILRGKIWIRISPLGFFVQDGRAVIVDYNPRKSLSFNDDHAAFAGTLTVPEYGANALFDLPDHKYVMLDLSCADDEGNRSIEAFDSDNVGFALREEVQVELQVLADAYKIVREQVDMTKQPAEQKDVSDTPLFQSLHVSMESDN